MGRKNKAQRTQHTKPYIPKRNVLPYVSICTPTFNRRPFLPAITRCIVSQDYPHDKIEWVVVDDGTDDVSDYFNSPELKEILGNIKLVYKRLENKLKLGEKRNLVHDTCTYKGPNNILVYMDDDDYYPVDRISHGVEMLNKNPQYLIGGSSILHMWVNSTNKMYQFGPYGPNHATAGTFIFRRKLLDTTRYDNNALLGEEREFLKCHQIPMLQLDSKKCILVFAHDQNTVDKTQLLIPENKQVKEVQLTPYDFIVNRDEQLYNFYTERIKTLNDDYDHGNIKNKPEELAEFIRRKEEREKLNQQQKNKPSGVNYTDTLGKTHNLTVLETIKLIQDLLNEKKKHIEQINELSKYSGIRYTDTSGKQHTPTREETIVLVQTLLNEKNNLSKKLIDAYNEIQLLKNKLDIVNSDNSLEEITTTPTTTVDSKSDDIIDSDNILRVVEKD